MMEWTRGLRRVLTVLVSAIVLVACSTDIEEYQGREPAFNLFEYFEGHTKAWGMVQDFTGDQTRRFEVDIKGTVAGNTLTLDESFVYADGETQTRVWTITRHEDGTYRGTAGDIVGTATGIVAGNALNWRYDLVVPVGENEYQLHFDDWMFRQDDDRLFNVTSMRKWGIEVGKVTLFFERVDK
ncbi:DUF3833 domain-containing protein [Salinivibrio sp. ES.052]|uniref:DUF3833 domain-containing protein n=1 Tax=Salinivibrio sp. ES.052 TaxID=1882823 RepID=UPI00092C62DE|nr:DUF3833 domain-containing protein [Salinivibrio sp. ES.052]SIO38952.1 Protein of unknown function [Salinivibrio sp. ES.052]